jgi:hypothetical protein
MKSWVDVTPHVSKPHDYVNHMFMSVTPRVTLFSNYLHYKLNQASSTMVNLVVEVRNQNSKSGVRI